MDKQPTYQELLLLWKREKERRIEAETRLKELILDVPYCESCKR